MPSKSKATKSSRQTQALIKGLRRVKQQLPIAGLSGDPRKWTKAKQQRIYNKYKPLATGQAQAVKLSRKMAARYEDADLKAVKISAGGYAIVPKEAGYSRIEVEKGNPILKGMIKHVRALKSGEIEHIILPYQLNRITDFMAECRAHPEWNKLKKDVEKFRFGFGDGSIEGTNWNGNRYGRLVDIADYLEGYEQVKRSLKNPSGSENNAMMSALIIVRVRGRTEIDERVEEQKEQRRERIKERQKAKYRRMRKERKG